MTSGVYNRKNKIQKEKRICLMCNKEFETKITSLKKCCCNSCATKYKWQNKEYKRQVGLNISNSLKGHIPSNKGLTLKEQFGEENAKEIRHKNGNGNRGRKQTQKEKDKRAKSNTGKKRTNKIRENLSIIAKINHNKPEVRKKHRIARLEQLKNNGNMWPSYNKKACETFKEFDKLNNTNGQYATKPYEFQCLGYSLDYFNRDLKLIIEVDEKHHFDENGLLKSKDIERQKEIQEKFPDFQFLRFKEEEMDKVLEIII